MSKSQRDKERFPSWENSSCEDDTRESKMGHLDTEDMMLANWHDSSAVTAVSVFCLWIDYREFHCVVIRTPPIFRRHLPPIKDHSHFLRSVQIKVTCWWRPPKAARSRGPSSLTFLFAVLLHLFSTSVWKPHSRSLDSETGNERFHMLSCMMCVCHYWMLVALDNCHRSPDSSKYTSIHIHYGMCMKGSPSIHSSRGQVTQTN